MAEHLCDVTNVRATIQHERGNGVSQEMTAAALLDASNSEILTDFPREPVRTQSRANRRDEEPVRIAVDHKAGTDEIAVEAKSVQCAFTDGDVAVFCALAATNKYRPSFEVHVSEQQIDELGASEGT